MSVRFWKLVSAMNSLVTTVSDCGMLTSGVFVFVATDVLLA
jgi:hypothetical protein